MRANTIEIVRAVDGSAPVKPPRLNFARVCLRCDERGCESPECVAWHQASCWMVCPECGGRGWSETLEPCGCMFGVVEAWPESADAGRLAAV
jgi:hypothetical protein